MTSSNVQPIESSLQKEKHLFFQNYARYPIHVSYARGLYLYSDREEKFLDLLSGIGVNVLGYGNKAILKAITTQINKYVHISNLFLSSPQFELAEKLLSITGLSKVYFCNSGTEAIETAIKLARKWASTQPGRKKKDIFALVNGFHGRTYGALSLTDKSTYRKGFDPLLPSIHFINSDNLSDLEEKLSEETVAVFLEFIQGEGGIYEVSNQFIKKLLELKEKFNFLIVADEIQSGCGRTGTFFSYDSYNVLPDIICSAKALGGGLPLGAVIGSKEVAHVFQKGSHGTTFGGNPVACAAGCAMIEEIMKKNMMKNSSNIGTYIKEKLVKLKTNSHDIVSIRQFGLMIGITMNKPVKNYVKNLLDCNIITGSASKNTLRLLPPLTIGKKEADLFISALKKNLTPRNIHANY